ncbi:Golgi integral membrane protein 4-like isoform X1 [Vespula maculifrons]|uniref:Golgi integral membrane protein 4-like isoform X1 n=1 Tax=Vespula maculifrons TaxID=7453 RepID=A0ABD2B5M1_VESMC
MSGSRLGRGRGGRLAVYGGCGVVIILLVFLYRAATSEMARLRDLHIQCVHQHESLAAQLQVIFEYKVRLEKSLAEEKSSNAAVKQELQQRASREKSLRDKDSIEAMQRFNSLQQTYKILQTEHQDLQEECKKREKQVLEETNRLESTLQDLRSRIRQTNEDKEKMIGEKDRTLENFKNKYLELDTEKTKLEEKYNDLMKNTGNTDSMIEHLRKEVIQLKRELDNEKKRCKSTLSESSLISPKQSQPGEQNMPDNTAIDPTQQERQQAQPQNVQAIVSSSSMKTIPALKLETSTKSNSNIDSVSSNKAAKIASKVKIPPGVLPILMIMDQNAEKMEKEKTNEKLGKNDEAVQSIVLKKKEVISEVNSKEKENEVNGNDNDNDNIDAPYKSLSGNKHVGDQIVGGRRQNGNWFKVKPGVQEFGEEPNPIDRLPGLESIVDRQFGAGEEQYVGAEYEPQAQKVEDLRLAEGEEEEDEDDPEDTI